MLPLALKNEIKIFIDDVNLFAILYNFTLKLIILAFESNICLLKNSKNIQLTFWSKIFLCYLEYATYSGKAGDCYIISSQKILWNWCPIQFMMSYKPLIEVHKWLTNFSYLCWHCSSISSESLKWKKKLSNPFIYFY